MVVVTGAQRSPSTIWCTNTDMLSHCSFSRVWVLRSCLQLPLWPWCCHGNRWEWGCVWQLHTEHGRAAVWWVPARILQKHYCKCDRLQPLPAYV